MEKLVSKYQRGGKYKNRKRTGSSKIQYVSDLKKLLGLLWDEGYYDKSKYKTREKAADGLFGNDTEDALNRAINDGALLNLYNSSSIVQGKNPILTSGGKGIFRLINGKYYYYKNNLGDKPTLIEFNNIRPEYWNKKTLPKGSILNGKAYKYDNDTNSWKKEIECAAWANSALRNFSSNYEVYGSAWERGGLGMNQKPILSGYLGKPETEMSGDEIINFKSDKQWYNNPNNRNEDKNPNYSSQIQTLQQKYAYKSDKRNHDAANRLKNMWNNGSSLDKSKVYSVNMFYDKSPNKGLAYVGAKNGTTGTHTGNLYWDQESNHWKVMHNIHGKIHNDNIESILGSNNGKGYGVTAITPITTKGDREMTLQMPNAPDPSQIKSEHSTWFLLKGAKLIKKKESEEPLPEGRMLKEVTVTNINPRRKIKTNERAKKFIRGINNFRNQLMTDFDLDDELFSRLAKTAMGILFLEGGFNRDDWNYTYKNATPAIFNKFAKLIKRGKVTSPSLGLTSIKYGDDIKNPILKKYYDKYNITNWGLRSDPEVLARATMLRLMYGNYWLQHNLGNTDYKKYGDEEFDYGYKPEIDENGEEVTYKIQNPLSIWWAYGRLTDEANDSPVAIQKVKLDPKYSYVKEDENGIKHLHFYLDENGRPKYANDFNWKAQWFDGIQLDYFDKDFK